MTAQTFDTTGELARLSRVMPATIRRYADMKLLDYVTVSNGTRLFPPGQADRVREILAQRMALRGRKRAT